MDFRKKKKNKAEVFTATMNDIMFFLMLFFIIVATFLNPHVIQLNLPGAQRSQPMSDKAEIQVSVNKDLQYFINSEQVPFGNLEQSLAAEVRKHNESIVVVRCDSSLAVQKLVNVLAIGNRLNVKMILATKNN